MATIRVTKHFHFEMAHSLYNYDGLCRNIHGHTYNLEITVTGHPLHKPGDPKDGMIIDFGILKEVVRNNVTSKLDHVLMVNHQIPAEQIEVLKTITNRLMIVPFQPTSENIVVYIAEILQQHLPSDVKLFSVRLYETLTSFADWFADEN